MTSLIYDMSGVNVTVRLPNGQHLTCKMGELRSKIEQLWEAGGPMSLFDPDKVIAEARFSDGLLVSCPILPPEGSWAGNKVIKAMAKGEPRSQAMSGLIATCEQRGQEELIEAKGEALPWAGSTLEGLAEAGIQFGDRYPDNPLFRRATLPAGWTLQADPDHEYWSSLRDPDGRVRFWVYYKATPGSCRAEIRRTRS